MFFYRSSHFRRLGYWKMTQLCSDAWKSDLNFIWTAKIRDLNHNIQCIKYILQMIEFSKMLPFVSILWSLVIIFLRCHHIIPSEITIVAIVSCYYCICEGIFQIKYYFVLYSIVALMLCRYTIKACLKLWIYLFRPRYMGKDVWDLVFSTALRRFSC